MAFNFTGVPLTFYQCKMNTKGELRFTYFSKHSEKLWGVPAEKMIEDSSAGLHLIHPDDIKTLMTSIKDSFVNLTTWEWTARLTTPTGEKKLMTGISDPETHKDGVLWNGVLFDSTNKEHADKFEVLKSIFSEEPTVFVHFELSKSGNIRIPYFSAGSKVYWDIDNHFVTATGSKFIELIHVDDREAFLTSVRQSAKTMKPWNWTGRIATPRGLKHIQGFSEPERTPEGGWRWVGLIVEIQDHKTKAA